MTDIKEMTDSELVDAVAREGIGMDDRMIMYNVIDELGNHVAVTCTQEEAIRRCRLMSPKYKDAPDDICLEDFMTIHWAWFI